MPKYKTKPVTIEAFQYFDDMGNYTYEIPVWFNEACTNGTVFVKDDKTFIKTINGNMELKDGAYCIRNSRFGMIPMNKEQFENEYEPAE